MMPQPCCMVVEDQALIGMSLEASLEEAGFKVAGPFKSSAQALQWLEGNAPELAVLDIMLQGGTSLQVARELKLRGVPFAIYSGLPPKVDRPSELQDVPWLEKPVSRETLVKTLDRLVASEPLLLMEQGSDVLALDDAGRGGELRREA